MNSTQSLFSILVPIVIKIIHRLDNECWQPLKPYQHRVISFEIANMSPLYFQVEEEGLRFCADQTPDVTFSGSLVAFLRALFTQNQLPQSVPFQVQGDLDFAKACYDCWQQLNLDWEGALAELTGDVIAHQIGLGLQRTHVWVNETAIDRQRDLAAYLQDETQLLPDPIDILCLFSDIDAIRDEAERQEARIELLENEMARH